MHLSLLARLPQGAHIAYVLSVIRKVLHTDTRSSHTLQHVPVALDDRLHPLCLLTSPFSRQTVLSITIKRLVLITLVRHRVLT